MASKTPLWQIEVQARACSKRVRNPARIFPRATMQEEGKAWLQSHLNTEP
jgi:hypothetical protein